MTRYRFGDVLFAGLPQSAAPRAKKRPVVVILDIGDADLVVAPITSKPRTGLGDLAIIHWRRAGLMTPSFVRLAKTSLVLKQRIIRTLGRLAYTDRRQVADAWRTLYDLKP